MISAFILSLLAVVIGCSSPSPSNLNHNKGTKLETKPLLSAQKEPIMTITLQRRQIEFLGIKIGAATKKSITSKVKTTGVIALPPTSKITLNALVAGRVNLVYKVPGEMIRKGEILATIQHPDIITLQEDYLKVLYQYQFLEQEWSRQKKLTEENIGYLKKFQTVEKEYLQAQAQLSALKARLNLLGIPIPNNAKITNELVISSPINGYLIAIHVNNGVYVQAGAPLFELMDNAHLHLDLQVFEKDIEKVRPGQQVSFQLASQTGQVFTGTITTVGKALEPETRAITVHAHFTALPGFTLLPGMYVSGYIATGVENAYAVPESSILQKDGKNYIFILQGKDKEHFTFEMLPVTPGETEGGYTTILMDSGFEYNKENIVLEGGYYLLAELRKGDADESHEAH
ncbi:MAG: efflux RND transporter periplasmic adaptor subunit [Bacteroidia bacterium]|nr:efflux RND transporter periplasmic adaptor subunit [Bacteroidia bacterium]MDW8158788.1 efflux RND transporter periplasmic adaptor subunit [Bacteroidia bacterium]